MPRPMARSAREKIPPCRRAGLRADARRLGARFAAGLFDDPERPPPLGRRLPDRAGARPLPEARRDEERGEPLAERARDVRGEADVRDAMQGG